MRPTANTKQARAMSRRDTRAGFTTLAVPFFFAVLFAAWLIAGPIALLAAPVIFRLALVIVPAPSRLPLPTCPYLARRDAERDALRAARQEQAATKDAALQRPEMHEVTAVPRTPAVALAAGPATTPPVAEAGASGDLIQAAA